MIAVAERLQAGVAKALLGKAVVPDDHPNTTGGIGLLGTRASQQAMEECDTLLIVEPGTPAGWERMLAARRQLLDRGAHIVAPCPHALACPLVPPDWCHFAQRVARSRMHRLSKGGEVPWEDEKFIYLAVSRRPVQTPAARVIAPPQQASGQVALKLCQSDGTADVVRLSKRHGAEYKRARRLDWGDRLPPGG